MEEERAQKDGGIRSEAGSKSPDEKNPGKNRLVVWAEIAECSGSMMRYRSAVIHETGEWRSGHWPALRKEPP